MICLSSFNMEPIKELRAEFNGIGEVKGYSFKQLARTKLGYIYEVTSNEGAKHYEVFRRKVNNQYNCITYPSSKGFGIYAWTTSSLLHAQERLNSFKEIKDQ